MTDLALDVSSVGLLRTFRRLSYPDPVSAALQAEQAGVSAIAVHLREDRLHIQDRDVRLLRQLVQTRLVVKVAPTAQMTGLALEIKPQTVIILGEKGKAPTATDGLDLIVHGDSIAEMVNTLRGSGIDAVIGIEPDTDQLKIAHKMNATAVMLHCSALARASEATGVRIMERIRDTAKLSGRLKMPVYLGGDLDVRRLKQLDLTGVHTVCMGHGIFSRAITVGLDRAVNDAKAVIDRW